MKQLIRWVEETYYNILAYITFNSDKITYFILAHSLFLIICLLAGSLISGSLLIAMWFISALFRTAILSPYYDWINSHPIMSSIYSGWFLFWIVILIVVIKAYIEYKKSKKKKDNTSIKLKGKEHFKNPEKYCIRCSGTEFRKKRTYKYVIRKYCKNCGKWKRERAEDHPMLKKGKTEDIGNAEHTKSFKV